MRPLVLFLLMTPFISFAQKDTIYPRLEHDSLVLQCGFKVTEKQMLKIGVGSTPDGDFKFIRRSATSMFQYVSTNNVANAANDANALPRGSSGLEYKVVRIDKRGTKKNGYVYYPIINVGAIRYEVDIVNAIAAGELVVPDACKPKPKEITVVVKQEVSLADELKKLKDLYDSGAITKEEYETAKKKLLEKQ